MHSNIIQRKKYDIEKIPENLKFKNEGIVCPLQQKLQQANIKVPINENDSNKDKSEVNSNKVADSANPNNEANKNKQPLKNKKSLTKIKYNFEDSDGSNSSKEEEEEQELLCPILKDLNLMVSKIDTIYGTVKDTEPYFKKFVLLARANFIINLLIISLLTFSMKKSVNNLYCWDIYHNHFVICNQDYTCSKASRGEHRVLYLNKDSNLTSSDTYEEFKLINEKYTNYFITSQRVYSKSNKEKQVYGEIPANFFNVKIYVERGERWYFINLFRDYCTIEHSSFIYAAFVFLIHLFLPILSGFLADVLGRKPIIIFLNCLQIVGFLGMFVYIHIITSKELNYLKEYQNKYSSLATNTSLINYLEDFTGRAFSVNSTLQVFAEFNLKVDSQYIVREAHSQYKFIFYFFISLISASICLEPIFLTLVSEFSLNDNQFHKNFFSYYMALPLSFIVLFFLQFITEIKWVLLVLGSLSCILLVCSSILIVESPRHFFEYREYKNMTTVLEKIVTKHSFISEQRLNKDTKEIEHKLINPLDSFYIRTENKRILFKSELRLFMQSMSDSKLAAIMKNGCCFSLRKKIDVISRQIYSKGYYNFKKSELLTNPFLIVSIFSNRKNISNNLKILIAMTINISFVYYIAYFNLYGTDFYSRDDLYRKISVNFSCIVLGFTSFISLIFFTFIFKFFDFTISLLICFIGTFCVSIIIGGNTLSIPTYTDLNKHYFGSPLIRETKYGDFGFIFKAIMHFFSCGLYYTLYYLILKNSKTIYRCTILSLVFACSSFIMFFSFGLYQYFLRNILYISIISALGIVNIYFLREPKTMSIINDFTSLEITE